jgi:cytochrome c
MKKLLLLPVLILAIACNNSSDNSKKTADTTATTKTNDLSNNPDYQKGLELIAKNDCFTCHQIDDKLNGPPYREVANKYASYPDTIVNHLAHKIISGGNGVWGEVMMTPHPSLSEADAEALVKYILLLKK